MSGAWRALLSAIKSDAVRTAHVAFHVACLSILITLTYKARFGALVRTEAHSSWEAPVELRCLNRAWGRDAQACGLNAQDCQPFETQWTTFWCSPSCTQKSDWEIVIGGLNGKYHPSSRLCMAAAHAGITGLGRGGCGMYHLAGAVHSFGPGSTANGSLVTTSRIHFLPA